MAAMSFDPHVAVGALPLVLGGNVFGWTADDPTSFALLDAYAEAGGRLVDTADVYSAWAPGHTGGESERVIGAWLAGPGAGSGVEVATKVAKHPDARGLAPTTVRTALAGSLDRLGADRVALYYAHEDDEPRPMEEIAATFGALVDEGLVDAIGASNVAPDRVEAWCLAADALGVAAPVVEQGQYNLMEREPFEASMLPVLERYGIAALPYYGLAKGFLTGKYRVGQDAPQGPRAAGASAYLDPRGLRVLSALDAIADRRGVTPAAVALAWLAHQPCVGAPIASARTVDQLRELLAMTVLSPAGTDPLTDDELADLNRASATDPE
jgi:aryl-alcohol dehydrogenase-like predicted oxidoreductase